MVKAKEVYIDIQGGMYKIKEVLDSEYFTYYSKNSKLGRPRWEYQGVKQLYILENFLKTREIVPYGKASKLLYVK